MEHFFPVWNNFIDLHEFFLYAYAKEFMEVLFMFVGVCDDNFDDRKEIIRLIEKQNSPVPVQILSFSTIYELEQSKYICKIKRIPGDRSRNSFLYVCRAWHSSCW